MQERRVSIAQHTASQHARKLLVSRKAFPTERIALLVFRGLSIQQLIEIFRLGLMPCERPVGKGGRLCRGKAGAECHC